MYITYSTMNISWRPCNRNRQDKLIEDVFCQQIDQFIISVLSHLVLITEQFIEQYYGAEIRVW
jgi:hypothetical protein